MVGSSRETETEETWEMLVGLCNDQQSAKNEEMSSKEWKHAGMENESQH